MHYAFQDKDNLYIIMDLLTGGDLRYHLCRRKKFTEAQTSKHILYTIYYIVCCRILYIMHIIRP